MARTRPPSAPRATRVPQQTRSRRTRERVLVAAVACFEERGFDATTTAQIARRARIAVGSVYGYFRDKRSILLELLHASVDEIADAIVKGLDRERWRGRAPRECVRELVDLVFHSQRLQPGVQRIIWERYFKDEAFRAVAESIEGRIRTALVALLVDLRDEGRVRVPDAEAAAFVVHAAVQWTASRLVLGNAGVNLEAATDAATDMVVSYLFLDSERS
jgi:AcrR family transcriptional regulator